MKIFLIKSEISVPPLTTMQLTLWWFKKTHMRLIWWTDWL